VHRNGPGYTGFTLKYIYSWGKGLQVITPTLPYSQANWDHHLVAYIINFITSRISTGRGVPRMITGMSGMAVHPASC